MDKCGCYVINSSIYSERCLFYCNLATHLHEIKHLVLHPIYLLCLDAVIEAHVLYRRRPSGVPEQDVCSGLVSYYKKQEEYMRIQLKKLQKENAGLAQKVQAGRENITHTEQRIAAGVEEWRV